MMELGMTHGWRLWCGVAALAALVWACDATSPTAGIDRGGVRTPVAAQGPIEAFGSIVIGGVHYDLGGAAVRVDGGLVAEADLALGQVVTVAGTRAEGETRVRADTVVATTNVQGPVSALDIAAGTVVVLGQPIATTAMTVYMLGTNAPSLASLHVGDVVRVSGLVGAAGAVEATRIERRPADSEFRVLGTAANVDTAAARFTLNTLVVSYAAAVAIEDFPRGQPANGDVVVAVGTALGPNGELLARTLERRGAEIEESEGREIEIEGFITRFVSPLDFDVAGVLVTTTATTQFEHGSAADLQLDLKVHVKGRVNAAQQLEAREVEIDD
jgi:hypothetical protein